METKEVVVRFLRVLPEFVIGLLVLVALAIHVGSEAPLTTAAAVSCQSSVLMTCGVFGAESVNGTQVNGTGTCVCVSDRSFFYGMVGAGAVFYGMGRALFNSPGATNLVFLVGAIFAVIGYVFAFVGAVLSVTEYVDPRTIAIGVLLGLSALISCFDSIYEFFKRRRESTYNVL